MSASIPSAAATLMTSSTDANISFCMATAARPAVRLGITPQLPGGLGAEPTSVSPRGSEAGKLLLQNRDPQVGLVLLQVVGRPQPRVAAADDGHVHIQTAGQ